MCLRVSFWGVRGSKPTPGKNTFLFGGNTSCVQVEAGGCNLIFDGGTGIAELGHKMMKEGGGHEADIFFSHLHWDHIQGLPFFTPLYVPQNNFRFYGEDKEDISFHQIIEKQMRTPYFPITMGMMKSTYEFINIGPDQTLTMGQGVSVKTFRVNHPGGCLAFKVELESCGSIVFCTDTEPMEGSKREDFLAFIKGADLMIYDTHFTDEEYYGTLDGQGKKGWGHSSWEEGTRIGQEGEIGYLLLYHYKENRSDRDQQEIEMLAKQRFSGSLAAREGMVIEIGGDGPEKVRINYPG